MKQTPLLAACFLAGFSFMIGACHPSREPACVQVAREEREMDATVVLLDSDTDEPHCSAVTVVGGDGSVVLVTAAHCVQRKVDAFDPSPSADKTANIGDTILYITREDWYGTGQKYKESTIKSIDMPRDRAVLGVFQNEAPVPVPSIRQCERCEFDGYPVYAVSGLFGWDRHDGVVNRKMFSGPNANFFESTMTVELGWSGSPVFNERGEAMGVVTRCNTYTIELDNGHEYKKCKRGWSLFTSIP
jgi:trypsin-like peptidase